MLGAKIAIAGSAPLGVKETGAGGVNGDRATDFAQTQHLFTPSTCAVRSRSELGAVPHISMREISPASNLTARWVLPAIALAISWNVSTTPQATASRPRPQSRNVPIDIMPAE